MAHVARALNRRCCATRKPIPLRRRIIPLWALLKSPPVMSGEPKDFVKEFPTSFRPRFSVCKSGRVLLTGQHVSLVQCSE
jgi:hypothetical protein